MTDSILTDILTERVRQHRLWGDQSHLPMGTGVGFTANADAARHVCDLKHRHGGLTFRHILAEEFWEVLAATTDEDLEIELVQLAAVCVQILEVLRQHGSE